MRPPPRLPRPSSKQHPPSRPRTPPRPSRPPTPEPAFIGLTGSIGAGKTAALAAFERLGAATLSADTVVHELYETDAVRTALRLRWGERVFTADGERVDREAVAKIVFNSTDQRHWLEGLLWPLAAQRTEAFRRAAAERVPPPRATVIETPLLFEARSEGRFDATITIVAPDALRAERLALRDQVELEARERVQLSQEEKARRSTFAVTNDGTLEDLERKLAAVLDSLAG